MAKFLEATILAFLVTIGVNIWNIWKVAELIEGRRFPECGQRAYVFFVGSIIASATTVVLYGLGIGAIFLVVWASLGQAWYSTLSLRCVELTPTVMDSMKYSLGVLWFDLIVFLLLGLLLCSGGIRGVTLAFC